MRCKCHVIFKTNSYTVIWLRTGHYSWYKFSMTLWYFSNTTRRRSFMVGPGTRQQYNEQLFNAVSKLHNTKCIIYFVYSITAQCSAEFTQLSSRNWKVLSENSPLLYALGIRGGCRVDSVDSFLNCPIHLFVFSSNDVRHFGGLAAELLAKLHSLLTQLLGRLCGFCITTTLEHRIQFLESYVLCQSQTKTVLEHNCCILNKKKSISKHYLKQMKRECTVVCTHCSWVL